MMPRRHLSRNLVLFLILGFSFWFLFLAPSSTPAPPSNPEFGRVEKLSDRSRYAVATFLTGGNHDTVAEYDLDNNNYFLSTRMLGYQLLHNPETRCNGSAVDFVVLVTHNVPENARRQLIADGALVVEAEPIPLSWWVKTGVTRWKDQFLKLRLFEMTDYDRLLFIDADSLITDKIDDIFNDLEVHEPAPTLFKRQMKRDEAPLPSQYMFGARSDNQLTGERDHPFPPLNTNVFSAGFWVAAPSRELYAYFMSVLQHYRRFDPHTMEQSMLNYAFRRDGPMPWRELNYKWSATWPNWRDVEGHVVSLHEKFWATGPQDLRDMWFRLRDEMKEYYASHPSTALHG